MISRAGLAEMSRCVSALTAPCVPTGMNAGVCTTPCGVRITPRRARAVAMRDAKSKASGHCGYT